MIGLFPSKMEPVYKVDMDCYKWEFASPIGAELDLDRFEFIFGDVYIKVDLAHKSSENWIVHL